MVSGEDMYRAMSTIFWIAQLKSYPMIYNMTYFNHICEEKNPKNRYTRILIFWPLLDFDPPGGGVMNYQNQ
jgi:hypothetical protein